MGNYGKIINEIVQNIDEHITPFFNKRELDSLARTTGFNKRCGTVKITGSMFLDLVMFNFSKLSCQSLEDYCEELKNRHGQTISRQSLQDRFNCGAVSFLKAIFEIVLRKKFTDTSDLKRICTQKRILIKDSTCFSAARRDERCISGKWWKR